MSVTRRICGSAVVMLVLMNVACSGSRHLAADESATPVASSTRVTMASSAPDTRCGAVAEPLHDGVETMQSGGIEREFSVAVPTGFDPERPTPLVVNFHGSGSNMTEQIAYSRLPALGVARGYVVVTPQGSGEPRGWVLSGSLDVDFTNDLIDTLGRRMCIDVDRIDAAGISNGSAFSEIVACRSPFRFAAIAMVAATLPSTCPADQRVAAVAFAGTKDPVVPFGGGRVNAEVPDSSGTKQLAAPGAEGAIAALARHNGCDPDPKNSPLGTDVVRRVWKGCVDGADVTFYRINGGGHTWPGPIDLSKIGYRSLGTTTATIDATTIILDFFDAHARA